MLRPSERGAGLLLGDGVSLPESVILGGNVVIHEGTTIGEGVTIHDGATLARQDQPRGALEAEPAG